MGICARFSLKSVPFGSESNGTYLSPSTSRRRTAVGDKLVPAVAERCLFGPTNMKSRLSTQIPFLVIPAVINSLLAGHAEFHFHVLKIKMDPGLTSHSTLPPLIVQTRLGAGLENGHANRFGAAGMR